MILYLADGTLPEDEKVARKVVLESRHFDLLDGVLHHENPHSPGRWCVAVPTTLRTVLLEDAHSGLLAGHLAEKRVYDRLRRGYWWQGMRRDVRKHCCACLSCATRRGAGRASHPPLQPIPVGGPFHCVGVDVLKLPLTYDGNQYVPCFSRLSNKVGGGISPSKTRKQKQLLVCWLRRSSANTVLQSVYYRIEVPTFYRN